MTRLVEWLQDSLLLSLLEWHSKDTFFIAYRDVIEMSYLCNDCNWKKGMCQGW